MCKYNQIHTYPQPLTGRAGITRTSLHLPQYFDTLSSRLVFLEMAVHAGYRASELRSPQRGGVVASQLSARNPPGGGESDYPCPCMYYNAETTKTLALSRATW